MRGIAFVLLAVLVLLPGASAQDVASPYAGCQKDAAWCDPLAANPGDPRTDDQPVRAILYAHHPDAIQRAHLNTQFALPNEKDVRAGFLAPTLYVGSVSGQRPPCCSLANGDFLWQFVPSLVSIDENGEWRVMVEPGFGDNLSIAGSTAWAYVYVSPSTPPHGSQPQASVVPNIAVAANWTTGRMADNGRTVASGDSGEPSAMGSLGMTTIMSMPGEDPVYEVRLPMHVELSDQPGVWHGRADERGSVVHIQIYQVATDRNDQVAASNWVLRSGAAHPPRLVFDMHRPVSTHYSSIVVYEGEVFVRWAVGGVLGTYDVDAQSVRASVYGPTQVEVEIIKLRYAMDHDSSFRPVNATWRLNAGDGGLAAGSYEVLFAAMNQQSTYLAEHTLWFNVDGDGLVVVPGDTETTQLEGEPIPSAAMGVVVIAALAAAVARRRDG